MLLDLIFEPEHLDALIFECSLGYFLFIEIVNCFFHSRKCLLYVFIGEEYYRISIRPEFFLHSIHIISNFPTVFIESLDFFITNSLIDYNIIVKTRTMVLFWEDHMIRFLSFIFELFFL